MTEQELQQYLLSNYPKENEGCEWKEFKNLKISFCGDEKDDVISYVSAIANMEGGFLVIGVHDKTPGKRCSEQGRERMERAGIIKQ